MYAIVIVIVGTIAEGAPIIPISAQLKYNIDAVCEYIVKKIPIPPRDFLSEPRLIGKQSVVEGWHWGQSPLKIWANL